MPAGKGNKPAGGYRAGKKGSHGCAGYPTVSSDGTVHGCHPTKAAAGAQARAIWASTAKKFINGVEKSMVAEGDFVMFICEEDEIKVGQVEYVMTEGMFGLTGSEYAMEANPTDPVLSIRVFEEEDGVWEATEELRGHRSSEAVKIESLSVSVEMIVEMGSSGSDIPSTPQMSDMQNMYYVQIGKAYEGCGCPTCKELNVNCENCPVCQEDMQKAKDNYQDLIKPRSGGSTPSNPKLYSRVIQAAKDKFDVYPSAVANAWVVAEYKKRGGTYKSEQKAEKTIWNGSLLDPKGFIK